MTTLDFGSNKAPLMALAEAEVPAIMALIVDTEGPSYRPVGAVMAFVGESHIGSLSSGCVERDLARHAEQALAAKAPRTVRYGRGSPYIDIQLPCGGGLEILLVPEPDKAALSRLTKTLGERHPATLVTDRHDGRLSVSDSADAVADTAFGVTFIPELRFLIFGKGPEASTFARLVQSAGYPNTLLSPDEETLSAARLAGCEAVHLVSPEMPDEPAPDAWSSVILFFHDHDWEPPILARALQSPAFYIGAQGSRRARDTRLAELAAMGIDQPSLDRLRGPIGLVPSARDPRTLAVSVLAEVLDVARSSAGGQTRDR